MATSGTTITANLPRGVRLPQLPPKDFNPCDADVETLKKYGLPPRPDKEKQPRKFEKWNKVMSHLRGFVRPDFESTGSYDITSSKWAGAVTTDVGDDDSFVDVEGEWNVPCPYPPSDQSGVHECNIWIGLDGYGNSTDLLRAGTLQRVNSDDSGAVLSRRAFAWYQWYPDDRFTIPNFPVLFGDTIWGIVSVYSETDSLVFFCNVGSQICTSFFVTAPDDIKLTGTSAEWIMEDPSLTESANSMANFASTFFDGCLAVTDKGREEDLDNAQLIALIKGGVLDATAVKENPRVLGIFYNNAVCAAY